MNTDRKTHFALKKLPGSVKPGLGFQCFFPLLAFIRVYPCASSQKIGHELEASNMGRKH